MEAFIERTEKIPFYRNYDVIVAGGGVAGVAAALATSAIVIDGEGDEPAWVGAYYLTEGLKNFTESKRPLPAELKTTLGVLCDKENLYFLVTAMEPSPEKMKLSGQADVNVYGDDSVEFFLYPPTAANTYYHLAVNAKGVTFDALGVGNPKDFDIPVEAASKILKDRYVIELKVPLAKLKLPERGEIWRFNFTRNRHVSDDLTPAEPESAYSGHFSLGGCSYHDTSAFYPLEIGTPLLRNGSFEDPDQNGNPNFWTLRGPVSVLKNENGNALKLENRGEAYQLLVYGDLRQSPHERKFTFTFNARGKGTVYVRAFRYTDTTDPKAKNGYRRKYHGTETIGIFPVTELPKICQGEYTIRPNEWIGFAFSAGADTEAVIDDASICLKKEVKDPASPEGFAAASER